jgi:GT2 family glycosyltransferase
MATSARVVDLGEKVPIGVVEIELSEALVGIDGADVGDASWVRVVIVVRLHSVPLGMFVSSLDESGGLARAELAGVISAALGSEIEAHLLADGLRSEPLTPAGLSAPETPSCQAGRTAVLADAPALSVVIPTRDRAARLSVCIDRILDCHYPQNRLEIVMVDNVPRDDSTRRVVERYAADGHPLVYACEAAPGSASARNRGMQVVSHDLVVFTDDDAFADEWWLAEVATAFVNNPSAGAVTGMLLPLELRTMPQLWFEQYGGFSRGFDRRTFTINRSSDPTNLLYPYAAGVFGTGNNMAFRRDALLDIGNFDPALGNGTPALGGVDSEVLLRTVLSGYPLVYEPRALVWHRHREDYESLRRQIYSYGAGLTAYLGKTVLHNPHLIADFARRLPSGLRFALSAGSDKNSRKTESYPQDLTRAERRGMAYGLLAYPRSRRAMGRHRSRRALKPR